jgi:hypothetical protein
MHTQKLLWCIGVLLGRFCGSAQGTFQNLDFEQANIIYLSPASPFIASSNAFPGWTVYANGSPQLIVSHDQVYPPAVAGIGENIPPVAHQVLDGKFSAILGGLGLTGGQTASIGQSGVVPADAKSLRFLEDEPFSVFFAGHSIPLQDLGNGPNSSTILGADISAYAGQYGQLVFQAGIGGVYLLDDITFSTQPIPEPGALSILCLGALMLSLRFSRWSIGGAFGSGHLDNWSLTRGPRLVL